MVSELPVGLSNYQTQEDPDGYDDERTFIEYSYSLCLKLRNIEHEFEVPEKRIYNLNDRKKFSLRDQIDHYISSHVGSLLKEIEYPEAERDRLTQELSVLVAYGKEVLVLIPRTVSFEYTPTREE